MVPFRKYGLTFWHMRGCAFRLRKKAIRCSVICLFMQGGVPNEQNENEKIEKTDEVRKDGV